MSLYLVQYFAHDVLINDTPVKGVQTVNISRSLDANRVIKYGDPTTVKNFYRDPNIDISFTKFLSNNVAPSFQSFSLTQTPPQSFNLQLGISDDGSTIVGLKLEDCLLRSATYSFRNDGFFTEQLTFNGRIVSTSNAGVASRSDTGSVKRRQDYSKSQSTNPAEVSNLLTNGGVLLSVEASFNANYGKVPTYGNFYSKRNRFLTYPVDISCSYEILDRKYGQPYPTTGVLVSGYKTVDDTVNPQIINIKGYPEINLGSNNFLTSFDRSGGDAGQGNYSIYKLTYKNNDGSFTIS